MRPKRCACRLVSLSRRNIAWSIKQIALSYREAQKAVERIESEIPTLQKIVCRQWSKTDELSRLKQECKELQHRIDESLKEAEQPQAAKHEAIAEAA